MSDQKDKKKKPVDISGYSDETRLIYGEAVSTKWDYAHHVQAPLTTSIIYRLDSVERGAEGFEKFANPEYIDEVETPIYIYDRLADPNKELLEENMAAAERGETAVTFATGMAAISAALGVLAKNGQEIITHKALYGCTYSLLENWLPRFGIDWSAVDLRDLKKLENAIGDKTRVIYFETPANPNLDIIDIPGIRIIVDKINEKRKEEDKIYIVVDNTFATPFCQRPIELGSDFTIHSLTKGLCGFGTDMGGVVVGPKKFKNFVLLFRKDFGGALGPKNAWSILTYGLPTLFLRMKKQVENATKIAEFLEKHPKVDFVNYPGLKSFKGYKTAEKMMTDSEGNFAPGSLIFFGVKGKDSEAKKTNGIKFMNYAADNAYTLTLAVSLGHIRTLIEHPASMTHSAIPPEELIDSGIAPGGIRISVGIENVDDIISDIEKSLDVI